MLRQYSACLGVKALPSMSLSFRAVLYIFPKNFWGRTIECRNEGGVPQGRAALLGGGWGGMPGGGGGPALPSGPVASTLTITMRKSYVSCIVCVAAATYRALCRPASGPVDVIHQHTLFYASPETFPDASGPVDVSCAAVSGPVAGAVGVSWSAALNVIKMASRRCIVDC